MQTIYVNAGAQEMAMKCGDSSEIDVAALRLGEMKIAEKHSRIAVCGLGGPED